jgi:uncharacterized protein (TIGR02646 family)
MRPVEKSEWPMGGNGAPKRYSPHTLAREDLESNLGFYCSYCEVFSSDLEVEHVISQHQDNGLIHDWNNFLLACGRCNGSDNKSNNPVDLETMHFPHRNNTLLSFVYLEGGLIRVNPSLAGASLHHAENMLNLVKLDKAPGNPKYPRLNPNDTRWRHRRIAWENAKKYLPSYEAGDITASQIVDFALQRGFFSIWFSVFSNHPEVKDELIRRFQGTDPACFDAALGFHPIHRNPANTSDPV